MYYFIPVQRQTDKLTKNKKLSYRRETARQPEGAEGE